MSLIQSIIGSAVGASAPILAFPAPGSNYPAGETTPTMTGSLSFGGYYDSISSPSLGLWRKAYHGTALNGTDQDNNFFINPTVAQTTADVYVGFGSALDGQSNYTMEWLGYFKPAVDGNFVFSSQVDDYMYMWMGQYALSNSPNKATAILTDSGTTPIMALTAGRYYPVRIRYSEFGGANQMALVTGLNETLLRNNISTGSTGQFFYDATTAAGTFPSGLIT